MPITRGQETEQVTNMSLYENINKRKRAGTSRSKKNSTISPEAYANMQAGFPKRKKAEDGGMMCSPRKREAMMSCGGSAHRTKKSRGGRSGPCS